MTFSKSDSIVELSKALSKAQGEIENATKNKTNPHFRSDYADLSAVLSEIREAFSPNGLSLTQMPFNGDGGLVGIEGLLMHSSGEWISSSVSCKPKNSDAPSLGTVLTYLRRYQASAIAGIAQTDDDGSSESSSDAGGVSQKPAYEMNKITMDWIAAVKINPKKLREINDPKYREFIKQKAGI